MSKGTEIAYVTTIMREKIVSSLLGLALYLGFSPPVAVADVWLCVQPNGTNLYSDRGGADFRLIKKNRAQGTAQNITFPVIKGLHQPPTGPAAPPSPPVR